VGGGQPNPLHPFQAESLGWRDNTHYSCNTTQAWLGSSAHLGVNSRARAGSRGRRLPLRESLSPVQPGGGHQAPLRYFSQAGASRARGEETLGAGRGAERSLARPAVAMPARQQQAPRRPSPAPLPGCRGRARSVSRAGGAPSPGTRRPRRSSPGLGPHQAELANFVVGHKAEDVLDGYDGQRHQCVVLGQVVRCQRGRGGCLGPGRRGLRRGRRGLSLSGAGSRTGAAVAVAAASFLSHPLLRRRRHLGSLIPSSNVRGSGHFLCVTSSSWGGGSLRRGRSSWDDSWKERRAFGASIGKEGR
jgi:hypothetical protein